MIEPNKIIETDINPDNTFLEDKTTEIIWKKLLSWEFVFVFDNEPRDWYDLYKICVIKIYQNDIVSVKKYISQFDLLFNNGYDFDDFNKAMHNFLFLICYFSTDTIILDWYYTTFKDQLYVNIVNYAGESINHPKINILMHMLKKNNKSIKVIKYLIEKCKIDLTFVNHEKENCLHYAISFYNGRFKTDLDIVKYLIDEQKLNLETTDTYDQTCIVKACYTTTSDLKLIKYLVEEKKVDITRDNGKKCIEGIMDGYSDIDGPYHAKSNKLIKNIGEKFGCIIDNTDDWNIQNFEMDFGINNNEFFNVILTFITNTEKLNVIIDNMIKNKSCPRNKLETIIQSIDLALLSSLSEIYIKMIDVNPFKLKYNNFVQSVDEFKCLPRHSYAFFQQSYKTKPKKIDHSDPNQIKLLFFHNNIPYHGNQEIIYNSMHIFKDNCMINFNETIVLEGGMPKYLVNIYLDSILSGQIDLNDIDPADPKDMLQFLRFVEQYPSTVLTIESLELQLIRYIESNNIELNDDYLELFTRCKLKRMYYYLHESRKQDRMICFLYDD